MNNLIDFLQLDEISPSVTEHLPDSISENYPLFKLLTEAYFEWFDAQSQSSQRLDIDMSPKSYLQYLRKEVANSFPEYNKVPEALEIFDNYYKRLEEGESLEDGFLNKSEYETQDEFHASGETSMYKLSINTSDVNVLSVAVFINGEESNEGNDYFLDGDILITIENGDKFSTHNLPIGSSIKVYYLIKKTVGSELPSLQKTTESRTIFYKKLKDYYTAKGTEKSYKFLFKAMYNEKISVTNPSENIFRTSEVKTRTDTYLCTITNPMINVDYNIPVMIRGKISKKEVSVDKSYRLYVNDVLSTKYEVSEPPFSKDFLINEPLIIIDQHGNEFEETPHPTIKSLEIVDKGNNAVLGDLINVSDGVSKAIFRINSISRGNVESVDIVDGGTGYRVGELIRLQSPTSTGTEGLLQISSVDENGSVKSISIINKGTGFQTEPRVLVDEYRKKSYFTDDEINNIVNKKILSNIDRDSSGRYINPDKSTLNPLFSIDDEYSINKWVDVTFYTITEIESLISKFFKSNFKEDENGFINETTSEKSLGNGLRLKIFGENIGSVLRLRHVYSPFSMIESNTPDIVVIGKQKYKPRFGVIVHKEPVITRVNGLTSNRNIVLADNFKYQEYSYAVRTNLTMNVWYDFIKETVHPAGVGLFSDAILNLVNLIKLPFNISLKPKLIVRLKLLQMLMKIHTNDNGFTNFLLKINLDLQKVFGSTYNSLDAFKLRRMDTFTHPMFAPENRFRYTNDRNIPKWKQDEFDTYNETNFLNVHHLEETEVGQFMDGYEWDASYIRPDTILNILPKVMYIREEQIDFKKPISLGPSIGTIEYLHQYSDFDTNDHDLENTSEEYLRINAKNKTNITSDSRLELSLIEELKTELDSTLKWKMIEIDTLCLTNINDITPTIDITSIHYNNLSVLKISTLQTIYNYVTTNDISNNTLLNTLLKEKDSFVSSNVLKYDDINWSDNTTYRVNFCGKKYYISLGTKQSNKLIFYVTNTI